MTTPPPVSATLTVTPAAPAHGATVTAVYSVTGNDPIPPASAVISGVATVGELPPLDVSASITLPGTPALPESFAVPTGAGLTFTVSESDPTGATFTAVVP